MRWCTFGMLWTLAILAGCGSAPTHRVNAGVDVSQRITLPTFDGLPQTARYVAVGIISAKGDYSTMPERALVELLMSGRVKGRAAFTNICELNPSQIGRYAHWEPAHRLQSYTKTTTATQTTVSPQYAVTSYGIEFSVERGIDPERRDIVIAATVPTWEKRQVMDGLQEEEPLHIANARFRLDFSAPGWHVLEAKRDANEMRAGTWIILAYLR